MGAGASIESEELLDKARAKDLAGGDWVNLEAKFDAEANEQGLVSAKRCREYYLSPESSPDSVQDLLATSSFCSEADLLDESVVVMMRMIDGSPQLCEQNLDYLIRSASMGEDEVARKHRERRERIAKEAEEALAKFESMSPAEKKKAQNNGDLEHYTHENQEKREAFFSESVEINALLDEWWKAASTYIDHDKDNQLTAAEYAVFHRRLLKIAQASSVASAKEAADAHREGEVFFQMKDEEELQAEVDAAGQDMTEEEMRELMEQDFQADAGEDGAVSMEEFRYAVFQLADNWTCTVDEQEYIDFLKKGYKIVFDDLIAADKLKVPPSWGKQVKKTKGITPMPLARFADMLSGIINEKIKADKVDNEKGNKQQIMEEYVVDYFQARNGVGKASQKNLKAFYLSLLQVLEDEHGELYEFTLLFAQMCGMYTPSGRISALPHSCSAFLLAHLDGVRGIMKQTGKQAKTVTERGVEANMGINAKTKDLISGLLEFDDTALYFAKVLQNDLGLNPLAPLFRVAMVSLETLATEVVDAKKPGAPADMRAVRRVIHCPKFTVLLAIVYAAWEETTGRKEASLASATSELERAAAEEVEKKVPSGKANRNGKRVVSTN